MIMTRMKLKTRRMKQIDLQNAVSNFFCFLSSNGSCTLLQKKFCVCGECWWYENLK